MQDEKATRHPAYRLLGLDGLLMLLAIYAVTRGALTDDGTFRTMWWVAAAAISCGPAIRIFIAFRGWQAERGDR